MCRSIKVLRNGSTPVPPDEISAAALQFVRKVSGSRKPSKVNQAAFDAAVQNIAKATEQLLKEMKVKDMKVRDMKERNDDLRVGS
jgi:hypothetical protein